MRYDLNVPWPSQAPQPVKAVQKFLILLQELGYTAVALNFVVAGKLKGVVTPFTDEVMQELQKFVPEMRLLRRVTLVLDEQAQNQSFTSLLNKFDIVAVQPKTEKTLQSAATALDIDLISIDMTSRTAFYLRHKLACAAVSRGVRFEICYGASFDGEGRRYTISNAMSIIRATRGRGIVLSSGAPVLANLRAPFDAINLLTVWGLNSCASRDAVGITAREAAINGLLRAKSAKQAVVATAEDSDSGRPTKVLKVS